MSISWEEYFRELVILTSQRSKDPVTKVGACIIDSENRIIGIGYNGFPRGIDDSKFPWTKESNDVSKTKYGYVIHAEVNAILNCNKSNLSGMTLYTTNFPCHECSKLIVQSGIRFVNYIHMSNKSDQIRASCNMFNEVGIK